MIFWNNSLLYIILVAIIHKLMKMYFNTWRKSFLCQMVAFYWVIWKELVFRSQCTQFWINVKNVIKWSKKRMKKWEEHVDQQEKDPLGWPSMSWTPKATERRWRKKMCATTKIIDSFINVWAFKGRWEDRIWLLFLIFWQDPQNILEIQ